MSQPQRPLDRIEDAIEDIKNGKVIIVVDDEDRENEGDFVAAARFATPEMINFMATEGRGLICAPLVEERCESLGLDLMVSRNNAAYETPFTVSVDLVGHGCTTGISAADRAKTIKALIDPNIRPDELGRPGHIFPLKARKGGVLRRAGHTEATIDLARLAGLEPAGVIVEIMNADGTMARLPELLNMADRLKMRIVSIEDLIAYRIANDTLIQRTGSRQIDTIYGPFTLTSYRQTTDDSEHFALTKGQWDAETAVPVRMHASHPQVDILMDAGLGKGQTLQRAMESLGEMEFGALVYLQKPHVSWEDTVQGGAQQSRSKGANADVSAAEVTRRQGRAFGLGAQILRDLGIHRLKLMSDTATVTKGMTLYGLEITEVTSVGLPHQPTP
ncbi:MAG: 3,4-dihydroxy-2-butanone-4-phosphate synthase [Flavobacteriales bacterium]|nr:3,4-dihydroxy-2-butanone-4-phosphate synthase [Flavobacteriales bacterium]